MSSDRGPILTVFGTSCNDASCVFQPHYTQTNVCSLQAVFRMLRHHCAASRKVKGSISDGVIANFYGLHPSSSPVDLGSTQPLTKRSTRDLPWGGGVKAAVRKAETLPPTCSDCLESWDPQHRGAL